MNAKQKINVFHEMFIFQYVLDLSLYTKERYASLEKN